MISFRCDNIFPPRRCPECDHDEFEYKPASYFLGPHAAADDLGSFICLGLADPGHPDKPLEPCDYEFVPSPQ